MVSKVRHGAAVALRGVLQQQAGAAAVSAPVAAQPSGTAYHSLFSLPAVTSSDLMQHP